MREDFEECHHHRKDEQWRSNKNYGKLQWEKDKSEAGRRHSAYNDDGEEEDM